MKKVIIVLNLQELTALELGVFANSILASMTGNANFPNPSPPLSDLQKATDNLNDAKKAARPGDKTSTSLVYDREQELKRVLKALASYVEYTANGEETIALSSGFETRKAATKQTKDFYAKQGKQNGTVDLVTKAEKKGGAYVWEYVLDPITSDSEWLRGGVTILCKTTISNLETGKRYWFRVAIVNKEGQQPFSDPYMVHVV